MMGDPTGITSLETDPEGTYAEVRPDTHGRIFHTNHIISAATSSYINEVFFLADTEPRLSRLQQLVEERITPDKLLKPGTVPPSFDSILEIMKDEEDAPFGICREGDETGAVETIFTIVSNCSTTAARVTIGRPCDMKLSLTLSF
jgi:hypothetical protein